MQKPEIISKFNRTNRTLYFVCVIFFFSLTGYLIQQYNPNDFRTLSNLFFAFGSFLLGIWILHEIYCAPKIVLFSNRIEIKRLFGLKNESYQRKEIISWVLRKKPSKYGSYENLYLVLDSSKKVKLCSYDYDNLYEFQYALTKNLPVDTELDRKLEIKENLKYSVLFISFGLMFLLFSANFFNDKNLESKDIALIHGHLSQNIKLESGSKSRSLLLKLNEYNEFDFKISSAVLREIYYEDLIKDFKKGDEIAFNIEKIDFEKKITKQIPLTFWDKIFHYDKIFIVDITNKDFKYLALEDYNKVHETSYLGIAFCLIFGLIMLISGIYMFKDRKLVKLKKVKKVNKDKKKKKEKILES